MHINSIHQHLSVLRKYARALTGDQLRGDSLAAAAAKSHLERPIEVEPRHLERVAVYRRLHECIDSGFSGALWDQIPTSPGQKAKDLWYQQTIAMLTSLEDFTFIDTAYILDLPIEEVKRLAAQSQRHIDNGKINVLIIEDEPILAMAVEDMLINEGYNLLAIAQTRDQARSIARFRKPDLILADIQLSDDSSGIDAVADIVRRTPAPTIFVTAYAERLLTSEKEEPVFLLIKPFKPPALAAMISQIFFLESNGALAHAPDKSKGNPSGVPTDPVEDFVALMEEVSLSQLQYVPAPILVDSVDGQLRPILGPLILGRLSRSNLENIAAELGEVASQLIDIHAETNSAADLVQPLFKLQYILSRPMTAGNAMALVAAIETLRLVVSGLEDRLDQSALAEIWAFADNLSTFAFQYEAARTFHKQHRRTMPVAPEETSALITTLSAVAALPDALVAPVLKEEIDAAVSTLESPHHPLEEVVQGFNAANILQAIARALKIFAQDVAKDSRRKLVPLLGTTIVAAPVLAACLYLGTAYPALFASAGAIFAAVQKFAKTGENKE